MGSQTQSDQAMDTIEELRQLGFTLNEAKAYIALLLPLTNAYNGWFGPEWIDPWTPSLYAARAPII